MAALIYLNPKELGERWRIGRTKVYDLIWTGQVPSVKVGRKVLIPVSGLEKIEAQLAAGRPLLGKITYRS